MDVCIRKVGVDMTAKKGQLKEIDSFEQRIRDNAVSYHISFFQPGTSTRVVADEDDLNTAKDVAKDIISKHPRVRAALIYALDVYGSSALMGTMDRQNVWKPVVPKTYK